MTTIYMAILKQLREESQYDGLYDEEDGEEYVSLLDEVDEIEFFLALWQPFSQSSPAEYQALGMESDADAQHAMALFSQELGRRQERKAVASDGASWGSVNGIYTPT
ncbi:hypothetical protein PINS_up017676 [Pythium insidiosum]|nr:hypothetical protein PINS_up017676 [Pythium insidiosum]